MVTWRTVVFEWISTLLTHFIIIYSPVTLIHYLVGPSLAPVILSSFSSQSSILGCIVFCFILICAHQGQWPFSDLYTVKLCSYCSSKFDSVLSGLVKTWFKCGRVCPCSLDQRACLHVHWLTAHATVLTYRVSSLPKLMSLLRQPIQGRPCSADATPSDFSTTAAQALELQDQIWATIGICLQCQWGFIFTRKIVFMSIINDLSVHSSLNLLHYKSHDALWCCHNQFPPSLLTYQHIHQ